MIRRQKDFFDKLEKYILNAEFDEAKKLISDELYSYTPKTPTIIQQPIRNPDGSAPPSLGGSGSGGSGSPLSTPSGTGSWGSGCTCGCIMSCQP